MPKFFTTIQIEIEAETREEVISKTKPHHGILKGQIVQPIVQITPEPWPMVLIPLKLLAKEGDSGAGDIIARTIGPVGGDAFKKWYKALFGKDCGCGNRQEALNRRWPL